MIYFFTGKPGNGKSLHMAQIIYDKMRLGRNVIANFQINEHAFDKCRAKKKGTLGRFIYMNDRYWLNNAFLDKRTREPVNNGVSYSYIDGLCGFAEQFHKRNAIGQIKEHQTLLVLDECQGLFNTRSWNRKDRLLWCQFLRNHRKYGYDVYLISQDDEVIDKQIRNILEYEVEHRCMEKSNAYFSASLLLTVIFTALVWAVFNVFSMQICTFFGANGTLMPFVKSYINPIVWTMPFFILSSYLSCLVRSDGAPNRVMAAVVIGGVFNIFADWLFVFPMNWGMTGAALATVLGTVIQFIVLCSHFFSTKCSLKLVKPFRPSRAFRNVLIAGFSAGVIDIAFIVLTVILNRQVLRYGGEAALAVFGVMITCSSMFQHLFSGVGQAIQPIVSMNFGAGQIQRICEIDKLSVMTALLMGIAFALAGVLFPVQITTFFVDATPEILEIAPGIVRVYFLSFLPMGVNIQATYYLQSVMRTKWSNILALLRGLIFSGVLVYLLPIWWGIDGVWWAMAITEFVVVIFSIICLRTADKAGLRGLGA